MVYLGKPRERQMHIGAKPQLFSYAREMRKEPTESENRLWMQLRKFRKEGYIFRRQHPIDIFIVDFYCHKLNLVIEVDGGIHDIQEAIEYDEGRSAELEKHDIRVLRFKNEEVTNDIELVLKKIRIIISELSSSETK
jgi:very-short-patch-repair endonuclease